MPRAPQLYIDADVFICVLRRDKDTWPLALAALEAAERGAVTLVASRLLAVEVGRYRGDVSHARVTAHLVRFLEQVSLRWWEVDLRVQVKALELSQRYKLTSQDAIHLATAVLARCEYFFTYDGRFPVDSEVDGVTVTRPKVVWEATLRDSELEREADLIAERRAREQQQEAIARQKVTAAAGAVALQDETPPPSLPAPSP